MVDGMNVPLYVTCCTAAKKPDPGVMPAAWRYCSPRLDAVLNLAVEHAVGFRVLSGEFGLVAAGEPIPDYDHLLTGDEVAAHAGRVADQLREIGPLGVVFFTRDAEADPGAQPYRSCCEEACRLAGVPCRVIELPAGAVGIEILESLL
jgi:hypothetical protein